MENKIHQSNVSSNNVVKVDTDSEIIIKKNYFGSYLRNLRESKTLSLRGLASQVGVYPNMIAELELIPGKFPNPDMARKLSDILGVEYSEFLIEVAIGKSMFSLMMFSEAEDIHLDKIFEVRSLKK